MRDQRIVIYEPAQKADPESAQYWGLLWLAVIVLLLASWGLNWTWREAEAVIAYPINAPIYTFIVLAAFLLANGLLAWGAWRILRRLLIVGRTLVIGLVDLVDALLFAIRNRLSRLRK